MRNMRNTYRLPLIIIPAFACLTLACDLGTARARLRTPADRRTTLESKFDPLGFPGDDSIITAGVPAVRDSVNEADNLAPGPGGAPDRRQKSQSFSVQVFASKSSAEARQFQSSVTPLFTDEVWIDYQEPYYKVCVGKASGFDNGEDLLRRVKSAGFPKAWLVKIKQ
jgi:hypothetical protein